MSGRNTNFLLVLLVIVSIFSGCIGGGAAKYTVSGKIVDKSGNGVEGVALTFTGGSTGTATTNEQGEWKATLKGRVTITPTKDGYTFEPASKRVNGKAKDTDFLAVDPLEYTAAGFVRDIDGFGLSGVTISFGSSIGEYDSVSTDSDGWWSRDRIKGTVSVIPTKQGYYFDPEQLELSETSNTVNFVGVEDVFAGGIGTEGSPFLVETAEQLNSVRNYLTKHFVQIADIDLASYNEGEGWEPIGITFSDSFKGSFDGGGYDITNLMINLPKKNNIGFFGVIHEAVISNVSLVAVAITGNTNVGSLVGNCYNSTIDSCYVTGTVNGLYYIGGMVGFFEQESAMSNSIADSDVQGSDGVGGLAGMSVDSEVVSCHATGDVTGLFGTGGLIGISDSTIHTNSYAMGNVVSKNMNGGLVGRDNNGSYSDCYATGSVTGTNQTGGLVGWAWNSNIIYCYATGSVLTTDKGLHAGGLIGDNASGYIGNCYAIGSVGGNLYVGGLVGANRGDLETGRESTVVNSFAVGQVSGTTCIGGLVGGNYEKATITKCFAVGIVSGYDNLGGLLGYNNNGSVFDSYFDKESTGQSDTGKGEPRSTEKMMQQATFVDWDFDATWAIDEQFSYPYLLGLPVPFL